tara:strand:- start:34 stop:687 length:654 start_codon:yes stop_codon:yes gene_type:complete
MSNNSDKGFSTSRGPKDKKSKAKNWVNYRNAIVVGVIGILLVGGFEFYQYREETNNHREATMKVDLYIPTLDVLLWGDLDINEIPIESEYKYDTSEFYRGNIMVLYGGIFNYEDRNNLEIIATYPNGTTLTIPYEYIRFERVACYDLFLDEDCEILSREFSAVYEIVWVWEQNELAEPYGRYNFEIINSQYEESSVVKNTPGCCRSNINVELMEKQV